MKFSYAESVQIVERAIGMRNSGMKWKDIRDQLGVCKTWLRNHIVDADYKRRKFAALKTAPELLAKARDLRNQGVRWKIVERELGVNWLTLAHAIYKQNKIEDRQ